MRRTALAVLVVVAVFGGALAARQLLADGSPSTAARSPAQTGTPTPIAVLLRADEAREIALREAELKGMVDYSTLSLTLSQAADAHVDGRPADYPVWVATSSGRFFPPQSPDGIFTEDHSIAVVIDALNGSVISINMADDVQATPLPWRPPPGGPPEPLPTATPLPVPTGGQLVSEQQIRDRVANNSWSVGGDWIDQSSVWIGLRRAGDIGPPLSQYAADYPIWILRAKGVFHPTFGPAGSGRSQFHRMMVFIDAITGSAIGTSLTDE